MHPLTLPCTPGIRQQAPLLVSLVHSETPPPVATHIHPILPPPPPTTAQIQALSLLLTCPHLLTGVPTSETISCRSGSARSWLQCGCLKADLLRSPLGSHFRVHAAAAGSKEPTRSIECACGLPFAPSGWWRGYVFTQESTNDRHERTVLVHHNDLLLPSVSGCISHGQSRFVRTSG